MQELNDLPLPDIEPGHLFCFGMGYSGLRLARRLLSAGWTVSGTTRTEESAENLRAAGVQPFIFDGESPDQAITDCLNIATHVINSVPPGPDGDRPLSAHGRDMSVSKSIRWAAYLSTPAVYGDRQGALVSEDDEPNPGSKRGEGRLRAELDWKKTFAGTDIHAPVFRLAGIYGPGRNVIKQLKAGTARIIEKPGQVFNRIHVDDIGSILIASMSREKTSDTFNVCDNEACASGDVIRYAAELLGMDPPTPIPFDSAELSPMARSFYSECKRLDNTRLSKELGVKLAYPTYREGLQQVLKEMTG